MMRRLTIAGLLSCVAAFAALHFAGARDNVGVLSGTLPANELDLCVGVAYVVAYFAVVLAVPIVALALILDAACGSISERWPASRRR